MNRLLLASLVLLACLSLLLALNLLPFLRSSTPEKYLQYNAVSGIAVEHRGLLYTLNFEQQNGFIDLINRALPITKEGIEHPSFEPVNFTKIVVTPFEGAPIVFTPVENTAEGLTTYCAELNPDGYLKEPSQGKLVELLTQTYDP
jgi:hypothetical protein